MEEYLIQESKKSTMRDIKNRLEEALHENNNLRM